LCCSCIFAKRKEETLGNRRRLTSWGETETTCHRNNTCCCRSSNFQRLYPAIVRKSPGTASPCSTSLSAHGIGRVWYHILYTVESFEYNEYQDDEDDDRAAYCSFPTQTSHTFRGYVLFKKALAGGGAVLMGTYQRLQEDTQAIPGQCWWRQISMQQNLQCEDTLTGNLTLAQTLVSLPLRTISATLWRSTD